MNKGLLKKFSKHNDFNAFENNSFHLYKQRAFLDEIIEKTITYNKNLNWNNDTKNLFLTTTAEELLEVYQLRSEVYTELDYQKEFPDIVSGLNFDIFDTSSGIVFYRSNNEITATCRLIIDSENKLPTDDKVSFDEQRKKYNKIGEISRNIVKYRNKGLNLEFKYLMRGMYYLTILNDIDLTTFVIISEDFKLFSKFGGIKIITELESYGEVENKALIISRESDKTSSFFKKLFL